MIPVLKRAKNSSTLILDAPYDPRLVDAVRSCIPATDVKRDGNVYYLTPAFYNGIVYICKQLFPRLIDQVGSVPEPQSSYWKPRWVAWTESESTEDEADSNSTLRKQVGSAKTPYEILYILPNAPKEVIQAAYRALAKMYHSDVGGSDEKMKELNAAYDRLK